MIDTFYFCALIKNWFQCYAFNVINIRRRISYMSYFNSMFALLFFSAFFLCFYFSFYGRLSHLQSTWNRFEGNLSRHIKSWIVNVSLSLCACVVFNLAAQTVMSCHHQHHCGISHSIVRLTFDSIIQFYHQSRPRVTENRNKKKWCTHKKKHQNAIREIAQRFDFILQIRRMRTKFEK